jgi:hypothetical protein
MHLEVATPDGLMTSAAKRPRRMMEWPPSFCATVGALVNMATGISFQRKESAMKSTTVAIDLAKSAFQLVDADWHVTERNQLTRNQFEC